MGGKRGRGGGLGRLGAFLGEGEKVEKLEGDVRDWRPHLVNKNAEKDTLDFDV